MAEEATQPLIGDVSTIFKFGKPEDFAASIETARLEQEAMCGYALVLKGTRQTHYQDDQNRDVYEVYATFAPAPAPRAPTGGNATLA